MNAENGSAIFGKQGPGQIVLDPTSDRALLYSSRFWNNYKEDGLPNTTYDYNEGTHKYASQANEGMIIDLTAPRILFGSGNFRVEPNGNLTASNVNVTGNIYADYLEAVTGGSIAGWTINADTLTGGNTILNSDGTITASNLIATTEGHIAGFTFDGYALYNGKDSWDSETDGIYICPRGIAMGPYTPGGTSASRRSSSSSCRNFC